MSEWIKFEDQTPPEGVPVWFYSGTHIWVGCYEYSDDAEPAGWFFGNTYGSHFWSKTEGAWDKMDNEWDDDYKVSHWMPLPNPPEAR